MENKVYLKKTILKSVIIFLLFIIIQLTINNYYYKKYTKNYNEKISSIVYLLKEKNPEITDSEISEILNNDDKYYDLSKYGIKIDKESIVYSNDKLVLRMILLNVSSSIIFFIILLLIYFSYSKQKDNKVKDIYKMIEDVSKGNYEIDFKNKSEDELSIFRDNLYKITLKLKEESINSLNDKKLLKENLENISHQLKTPLTAISISVDNILDSKNITDKKRREFFKDIKKETNNISFLVKSLLELSRFDANVVKFQRKDNDIFNIVDEAIKRVDLLRDLKNIEIITNNVHEKINCDFNWQVEAISNIIKNAIEHSIESSIIKLDVLSNDIYTSVKVINYGNVIDKEDLKNIFRRFYNGKNSINNSTGIGLSLSKSIIEKDNGKIFVDSFDNTTVFEVKYYK